GCTASPFVSSRRCPVSMLVTHNALFDQRMVGLSTGSSAHTMNLPSGDQDGEYPDVEMRRTDSPVAPITNMPPPSRPERNAMRSPSAENAGSVSSTGESAVRLMLLF